jgi:hypothetical protein
MWNEVVYALSRPIFPQASSFENTVLISSEGCSYNKFAGLLSKDSQKDKYSKIESVACKHHITYRKQYSECLNGL